MFFLYVVIITVLIALYVIKFAVFPLPIAKAFKMLLSAFILLSSQSIGLGFLLSSIFPVLNTEVGMTVLGFCFSFVLFLFVSTLALNLLAFVGVFAPLYSAFALAFILSVVGVFLAVRVPNVKTISVDFGLDKPFKLVQLSDLHIGSGFTHKWLEKVVEKTNALNPDAIVITGDLIDGVPDRLMPELQSLKKLKAPVYFIYGNHEYYYGLEKWKNEWAKLNLNLLENQSVDLGAIIIGGVGMPGANAFGAKAPNISETFFGSDPQKPKILLAHYPELFNNAAPAGVRLQLSGHTHGGQLFWPLNILTKRANAGYLKGAYYKDGAMLYVSSGTGLWGGLPLRMGTTPEITLFILK